MSDDAVTDETMTEPTEVDEARPGFAVARGLNAHGEIRFSTTNAADVLELAVVGPNGFETRIALRGPEFVLPFAPVGRYQALHAAALEPPPLPDQRRTPGFYIALEHGPALGAWSDAVEFEVHPGERTLVELP